MALAAAFDIEEAGFAAFGADVANGALGNGQGELFGLQFRRGGGQVAQMLGQDLGYAVGQAAHAVGAKAQGPAAANPRHLVHDPA